MPEWRTLSQRLREELDLDSPGDSAARSQKTRVPTKLKSGRERQPSGLAISSRGNVYKSIHKEVVVWKTVL